MGGGYKSRRCSKKTSGPFRLLSSKLGEESGVFGNQSEQLSGVWFEDTSISSNFKSHLKRNFETKEGTNEARTVDGRHASPSRTLSAVSFSVLQVGLSLRIKRRPAMRDSNTCCVSYYYPPSALLRPLLCLRQSPCSRLILQSQPRQNFLNTNSRRFIQAASSSREGILIHL